MLPAIRGFADLPEADEGVHFMNVAADVFRHRFDAMKFVVGGKREEMFFSVGESPEE